MLQGIFGNPTRIISDRGAAFTSHDLKKNCEEVNVHHVFIITGILRGSGQMERVNDITKTIVAKLSINEPDNWFKYVPKIQMSLNSS